MFKRQEKNKSEPQLNEKCIIGTILFWISLKYYKIEKTGWRDGSASKAHTAPTLQPGFVALTQTVK